MDRMDETLVLDTGLKSRELSTHLYRKQNKSSSYDQVKRPRGKVKYVLILTLSLSLSVPVTYFNVNLEFQKLKVAAKAIVIFCYNGQLFPYLDGFRRCSMNFFFFLRFVDPFLLLLFMGIFDPFLLSWVFLPTMGVSLKSMTQFQLVNLISTKNQLTLQFN